MSDLHERLEAGEVAVLDGSRFALEPRERRYLSEGWHDGRAKHVSRRAGAAAVHGTRARGDDLAGLRELLERYAGAVRSLVHEILPGYAPHCVDVSTSLRLAPIRPLEDHWRRDDTRLHVDAFTSNPSQGKQLLRVFTNVDPAGVARVWEVGESFPEFARRFGPRLTLPLPASSWMLRALRVTRGRRTPYDHLMLRLHDLAKSDREYQRTAPRRRVPFPSGATWIALTDRVVHAATVGQFALEHTFFLDPAGLRDPGRAPLATLEAMMGRRLT